MIINKLKDLLRASDLPLDKVLVGDLDTRGVFSYRIPSEFIKRDDFTLLLLDEIRNTPDEYAGDHARKLRQRFQIQVWYKKGVDVDKFEWQLNRLMEENHWFPIDNLGHDLDEETSQLKITLRYEGLSDGSSFI